MKHIDPIISTAGMVIVSTAVGIMSTFAVGVTVFVVVFVVGLVGDKIMGNLPTTHS